MSSLNIFAIEPIRPIMEFFAFCVNPNHSLGSIRRSAKKKRYEQSVQRGKSSLDQPDFDESSPFQNSRSLARTPPPSSDDGRRGSQGDTTYSGKSLDF